MSIIIANWKMYFTLQEAEYFCKKISLIQHNNQLIIAAPTPYLAYLTFLYPKLKFAAQNVSRHKYFGPYTGEYSAEMLKSCQINYTIIGHSERRKIFLEDSEENILLKVENTLKAGIIPIICLGDNNNSKKSLNNYLQNQLDKIIKIAISFDQELIVSYEPESAIGTGKPASLIEIKEIFSFIKKILYENNLASKIKLVYGGSVGLKNIASILEIKDIDGVLIGNCSINLENFIDLIERKY